MGTDGLVYKREASEQDDSVEDLVNITKGKCLRVSSVLHMYTVHTC